MALIKCPNCGEQISDKATVCPKCGKTIDSKSQKKTKKEIVNLGIVIAFVAGILVGGMSHALLFNSGKSDDKVIQTEQKESVKTSDKELSKDTTVESNNNENKSDTIKEVAINEPMNITHEYGLLQKQTDQQQRYYFRMNTKGERKKMYVLKNGKNFYIRIENGSVIKTPKFVEATKFRNTEIAQTVIDLKPGQLHSYRVCDVYNKIVYPKGRTRVIYTPRERKMIYHKAEGRCQLCGCKITYDEMSLDHIVPLAMGGEDSLENLQATCEPCNSHKKALLPEAYFDKVNRTFVFQMNKKYSHNLLWKLSKLFIGRLEKQA